MQPRSYSRFSVRLRLHLMISGQDEGCSIAEHSSKKEAGKQELRLSPHKKGRIARSGLSSLQVQVTLCSGC